MKRRTKTRVTCHTSHVTPHTSHVTRHTSHLTRHTILHVTRHTSHLPFSLLRHRRPASHHHPRLKPQRVLHHRVHRRPLHQRRQCKHVRLISRAFSMVCSHSFASSGITPPTNRCPRVNTLASPAPQTAGDVTHSTCCCCCRRRHHHLTPCRVAGIPTSVSTTLLASVATSTTKRPSV